MIAQLVIVFYFIVCVGIIIFNCFTEIISRYRSCVLKRREQRYCEEYRQLFLENITENKKQYKRYGNHISENTEQIRLKRRHTECRTERYCTAQFNYRYHRAEEHAKLFAHSVQKKIGYGKGLFGLCICHISYDEIPG